MNLTNLKEASNYQVKDWLENSIKLTQYQKESLRNEEIIRFAPFYFMEQRSKTNNIFLRFTIIFMLPVFLVLIAGLPFNFFATGRWGYNFKKLKWYM